MNEPLFNWHIFSDGSGHMKTALGHDFYPFDKSTDEIFYPDGRVLGLSSDWKADAEQNYTAQVLPKEKHYADMLAHNIYVPYFYGRMFHKDLLESDYVLIADEYIVSKKYFLELFEKMRILEDRNFSDHATTTVEAAKMIKRAVETQQPILFEGEGIPIRKEELLEIPQFCTTNTL